MKDIMNNKNFGKVAVLMGGEHSEREISLMSGNAVLQALLKQGIDAHGVDVGPNICETLLSKKYDRVFVALHGTQGEDGTIQGLLEYLQIPYTGSDVLASAIAMNKEKTKLIFQSLGLPTLPFMIIHADTHFEAVADKLGLPLSIKPTSEGSSVGVYKVLNQDDFQHAVRELQHSQNKIMAEHWIDGDEYTVGILDGKALPVIRISTPEGFYDYKAKYFSEATGYYIPSALNQDDEISLQKIALDAYHALDCKDWGRVDALRDPSGKFWLLEVNTIPGLTSHSLVPMAAKAEGITFEELVVRILKKTL